MNARFISKADIDATQTDVCFVPIADIRSLFDYLIGAGDERRRYGETEHPGGLGVDDQCSTAPPVSP